jgi:putative membrane protein
MKFFINIFASGLAVYISSLIVPGVKTDFLTAIIVGIVLGILNTFVRPILVILTLPINVLTLGLFLLVINTFLVYVASALIPAFAVGPFLSAFLFSIVLSITNSFLNLIKK